MKKSFVIFSISMLWSALLFAQGGRFTATTTKTNVGVGEQFEIDFSVAANGQNGKNIADAVCFFLICLGVATVVKAAK